MKTTPKICKGTGKAKGHGCGQLSNNRKFGLCPSCFADWVLHTENGQQWYGKQTAYKKKVKKRDYKQLYLDYFHLDKTDFIACENCGKPANDIHHLTFRSQGGTDKIENLIAVCRDCHNKAHNSKEFNEKLRKIHLSKL